MNQFLCETSTETKEIAPLTWAMENIDYRLNDLARHITQQLKSIQEHALRLSSDFGIGETTQREPHILAYQVQGSLESLGVKVREISMLQEQHIALVLLRRDLSYALND